MGASSCNVCDKSFKHNRSLLRHMREKHHKLKIKCMDCKNTFARKYSLKNHTCKKNKKTIVERSSSSLKECLVTVKYKFTMNDLVLALTKYKSNVIKELNTQLNKMNALKWNMAVFVDFRKDELQNSAVFRTDIITLLRSDNIENQYSLAIDKIMERVEKFTRDGSGWIVDKINGIDLCIVKFRPIQLE